MVICLERGADLHMAQLMTLPLTVSCSSKIQIASTFLVPAHPGSPGKRAVKHVCVCVYEITPVVLKKRPLNGYFVSVGWQALVLTGTLHSMSPARALCHGQE